MTRILASSYERSRIVRRAVFEKETMRMASGAEASGDGATVSVTIEKNNTQGGYTISGAGGEKASAWGLIEGGQGDVIAGTFKVGDREIAMAVTIGKDPHQKPGKDTTTLVGRAAMRRR